MNHQLLYFLGLALLVLPSGMVVRGRFQLVTLPELAERSRHRLGWVHWLNLVDLARAWAGMLLVQESFARVAPGAAESVPAFVHLALVALAGLILQHFFHRAEEADLVAPVAYALGLTLALLPPQVALLGPPLALAATIGFRSLGAGFILAAAVIGGLGYLTRLPPPSVVAASGLLFAPALLAGLVQRRLVLAVRARPASRPAPLRDIPVRVAR